MKIGILTFHRAINYGAFLQAFSLKTYLESLGHDVSIIDYWPKGHAESYKLFNETYWKQASLIKKVKYLILFLLSYIRKRKRLKKMERLQYIHLSLTKIPIYTKPEDLSAVDVDCVIYGSDQIWWKSTIPSYSGFDPVLWGNHIKDSIKRISYAASMGVINLTNEDKATISSYLKNFDAISVRETGLKDVLTPLTDKNISVVIDPVFLTPKEKWLKYCKPIKCIPDKYVLLYNLLGSKDAVIVAQKLAEENKCEVVEITGSVEPHKIGKKYVQTADAFEFISLINHAEFVVTSSFHGVAFSTIFQKQFYALGFRNNSGRVVSLLNTIGLTNRLITDYNDVSKNSIDYSLVSQRMEDYILSSKEFLFKELS